MSPPDPSVDTQQRQRRAVRTLDANELCDDPAFEQLAHAVTELFGTPVARIALSTPERDDIIGTHGVGFATSSDEPTFCGQDVVDRELVVVDDANDDPRFGDQAPSGIAFYVGVPLILDDVPVGTLATMAETTDELQAHERVELFGIVNAAESHLGVIYNYGPNSSHHILSSKLTRARAIATDHRASLEGYRDLRDAFGDIETEIKEGLDQIVDPPDLESETLGEVDTAPDPSS